jgi:hypothetical protein
MVSKYNNTRNSPFLLVVHSNNNNGLLSPLLYGIAGSAPPGCSERSYISNHTFLRVEHELDFCIIHTGSFYGFLVRWWQIRIYKYPGAVSESNYSSNENPFSPIDQ